MRSWKLIPNDQRVANYIECYWFLEKESGDQGSNFPKLYPDPSAHIIIAKADYQYQYTQETTRFRGHGSHCLYPHRNTIVMDHSEPFTILGIKLKIGSLYSANMRLDRTELDNIVSLDTSKAFGDQSFDAKKVLSKSQVTPEDALNALDKILIPCLADTQEDRHSELVRRAIPLLSDSAVGEIGGSLNCSQRTIERSFLKVTGFTLKQCQSMLRFEEILEYLYQMDTESIDWLDVAYEFGFSDQPHLIRHLKSCIGATPVEYARQRDLTIDVYGNFEFD